ncbi:hypothetical protein Cgig2_009440 [Carnegiea gigantea]|uniref:Uncharacterized protein n=1 Tax=Carnegiea gigantea TaxID=171969 RepID=A0A9Q1K5M8_9CARY|nr:hypothetical protein Cgig2_009440 [Carnegiea gigantea]
MSELMKILSYESRISIDVNPSLISILEDFNDDRDKQGNARMFGGRISVNMAYKLGPPERIMVPLNKLLQPIKMNTALGIVKQKTSASNMVFLETTVQVETFAYRKLMGPERSGRVRGVGYGVTSNQLDGKCIYQNGIGASNTTIVSDLLKEVDNQNVRVQDMTNVTGSSNLKELNIAQRLNFDQVDEQNIRVGEKTDVIGSPNSREQFGVSLELPVRESDLNLEPMAKSAPARGTLGLSGDFFCNDESATKTLC